MNPLVSRFTTSIASKNSAIIEENIIAAIQIINNVFIIIYIKVKRILDLHRQSIPNNLKNRITNLKNDVISLNNNLDSHNTRITELENQIQDRKSLSDKLIFGIIKENLEG